MTGTDLVVIGVVFGGLFLAHVLFEVIPAHLRARRRQAERVAEIRARHARGESVTFYEARVAGIE